MREVMRKMTPMTKARRKMMLMKKVVRRIMRKAMTGGTAMRSLAHQANKLTRQNLRISFAAPCPSPPSTQQSRQLPPPPPSASPSPPSSFTSVATISLAAAAPTKADTRPEIVNRVFNEKYSTATREDQEGSKSKSAKVHFSDKATWQVIEEPEELADDLCEARCSDLEQRRADRERMERLLGPVLTPVHRRRMYCKIYGELEKERCVQANLEERQDQSNLKEEYQDNLEEGHQVQEDLEEEL